MSIFSWVYKPYTFWYPPPRKSTHQNFLIAKNPHENNKNLLKCTEKLLIFTDPLPSPRKCIVCTLLKMLTFMDGPLLKYLVADTVFCSHLFPPTTYSTCHFLMNAHHVHGNSSDQTGNILLAVPGRSFLLTSRYIILTNCITMVLTHTRIQSKDIFPALLAVIGWHWKLNKFDLKHPGRFISWQIDQQLITFIKIFASNWF